MNSRQLTAALTSEPIEQPLLEQLLETLARSPMLYDDGKEIGAEDYFSQLGLPLKGPQLSAARALFDLGVLLCRRFSEETAYETMQDCLSLQLDLWKTGTLSLGDWIQWMEQAKDGRISLPEYHFAELLSPSSLPEGFMIQDFHDLLLDLLHSQPDMAWALAEQRKLYTALGVPTA